MEARNAKEVPYKAVVATVGSDHPRFILTHAFDKTFCPPFWYVRTTDKRDNANLEMIDYDVDCKCMSSAPKRTRASTVYVRVPCAVNFCEVQKGEELVLFKPAPVIEKKDKKHSLSIDGVNAKKVRKE